MTKIIRESENKRMGIEIKGKRARRAAFSYSLAILFSCALVEAQGAKLCQISADGWVAGTPVSPLVELAVGQQDINANIEATAWSATRASTYGAITGISGQALCTTYNSYINNDMSSLMGYMGTIEGDQYHLGAVYCFCRRTKINGAPNIGKWVEFSVSGTKTTPGTYQDCRNSCAASCLTAFSGCANCKSILFPLLVQTY